MFSIILGYDLDSSEELSVTGIHWIERKAAWCVIACMNFVKIPVELHVYGRKMVPIRVHPSVLVTCTTAQSPEDDDKPAQISGSGFILDPEEGLVATSASWITSVKSRDHVRSFTSGSFQRKALISEVFGPLEEAKWCVFAQATCQEDQTTEEGDEVVSMGAEVLGVHLMESVYSTLEEQLSSLAQWRWSPAAPLSDSTGATGRTENASQDLQSLLLPLSCVVILQLSQKIHTRFDRHLGS